MNKALVCFASAFILSPTLSYAESYFSLKDDDGFKRFSVSVGALHVMPQGKAQPIGVNTAIKEGEKSKVGDISIDSVKKNMDPDMNSNLSSTFVKFLDGLGVETLSGSLSGTAEINGLSQWDNAGTGLEADDVTTLGLMTNYFFTDHLSLEVKAGVPPKVDIQGQGKIYAPFQASATPEVIGIPLPQIDMKNNLLISDLENHGGAVAEARAWTPAAELQYHFDPTSGAITSIDLIYASESSALNNDTQYILDSNRYNEYRINRTKRYVYKEYGNFWDSEVYLEPLTNGMRYASTNFLKCLGYVNVFNNN